MRIKNFLLIIFLLNYFTPVHSKPSTENYLKNYFPQFIAQQTALDANNINSWIINTGIIDNNINTMNTPGFEWPKGSHQDAIFTAGLTTAALYNSSVRMASAMYEGEYYPGYIVDSSGIPVARTDDRFKIYSVKRGDSYITNPDWLNWGLMVPYGAPFIDVNHNGTYEANIDTPGVKNAAQTIFVCLTDGFPDTHYPSEGFGGGTLPLYIESHLIAWCYDAPDLNDVQFIQWSVINKSHTPWISAYFSITCDPDLGCPNDDYLGCDTTRGLGFCYNGEDMDCSYNYQYYPPIPAVGIMFLNCNGIQNVNFTSFDYITSPGNPGPICERDPNPGTIQAYNYMKGTKNDETPWMIPPGGDPAHVTKFVYSGDPETGQGWCEAESNISGSVWNCGGPGHYSGDVHTPNPYGERRMILNSGSDNLTINPGDTHKVLIAQLIARGTSRKNSVTKLKILADTVKAVCSRGFLIGIEQKSSSVPSQFYLYQNYPNPFNPTTVIKFEIPASPLPSEGGAIKVTLKIYDILGKEIASLIPPLWGGQEGLKPGSYKVEWDGANYPSGVYFYKIRVGDFVQTKKMVLMK